MNSRNADFLSLIDRAVAATDQAAAGLDAGRRQTLLAVLQGLRARIESGQLEPSGGVLTLGLAQQVADQVDSLASPVLRAVGELERFYQERYRD